MPSYAFCVCVCVTSNNRTNLHVLHIFTMKWEKERACERARTHLQSHKLLLHWMVTIRQVIIHSLPNDVLDRLIWHIVCMEWKKKPLRITIINKKMNNKWTLLASSMICSMYLSLFSTPFVRPSFDFFVSSTLSVDLHQNYLQFYLIILQTHRLKFGLLSTTADRLSILHFEWTRWPWCGLK